MAKTKLPTFLGKPLKRDGIRDGKLVYIGEDVFVLWDCYWDKWVAHWDQTMAKGDTPQQALDKCEAVAIKQFRAMGAKLGYDVE